MQDLYYKLQDPPRNQVYSFWFGVQGVGFQVLGYLGFMEKQAQSSNGSWELLGVICKAYPESPKAMRRVRSHCDEAARAVAVGDCAQG